MHWSVPCSRRTSPRRNPPTRSAGAITTPTFIAYRVLWSIRDPEQFLFELRTPEDTISQVAESSMRQVVSQMSLNDVLGIRRGSKDSQLR